MNPKRFDYYAPKSLDEAIDILRTNEDSKILAGGQSLIAVMKLRLAAPSALIDITGLSNELSYVKSEDDKVRIGALTTHDTLEHNPTINREFPIITDALEKLADQQVRNRGTIGGSCCHADPAADLPVALLALDPEFVVRGNAGEKVIPASEFFVDTFTVALRHDEILTEVRIPKLHSNACSAYIKHSRREADFAIVSVGTVVDVKANNTCEDARISLGAVAPTPVRAKDAEEYLRGKTLDEKNVEEAALRAQNKLEPPSDIHGSAEYRREMAKVFTKRTLMRALERSKLGV